MDLEKFKDFLKTFKTFHNHYSFI